MTNPIIVPLTQGKFALIDAEDAERVLAHKWCANKVVNPSGAERWYARCRIGKRFWFLHRFVLGLEGAYPLVDHKNHDGLDCQKHNMREATSAQNAQNQRKRARPASSQYRGVYYDGNGRWKAQIQNGVGTKRIYLGRHETEEGAARAYDAAAIKLWGEFACLNLPSG